MFNKTSLLCTALATLSFGATAQAAGTNADSVLLAGMPYSASTDGEYFPTGELYQEAPVYVHANGNRHLYRRADGKWYVDFNTVSEDWSGTLAYASEAAATPWLTTWHHSTQVATRTSSVFLGNLPYAADGEWVATGEVYQSQPVLANTENSNYSLYRRENGRWHADFNDVSEDWNGTFAYTTNSALNAWDGQWQGSSQFAMRMDTIEMDGLAYTAYSAGEYVYTGETYEGAPVFTHTVSGWKLYRRATGRWHVDFNDVSEDWDGTIAQTQTLGDQLPHLATWSGSATALPDGVTAIESISLKTKQNRYVVAASGGGAGVSSTSTTAGTNETFDLIELNSGFMLLRTSNGQFICPDNGGGGDVNALAAIPSDDCMFTRIELNTGKTIFMTATGHYLRSKNNTSVVADRTLVRTAEMFTVIEQ